MPPSALLVLRRGSLVAHINDVSVLQAVADAMLLTAAANVATQGGPELEGALAEHEDALRAARQHRGATIVADAVAELIKMEPCAAASAGARSRGALAHLDRGLAGEIAAACASADPMIANASWRVSRSDMHARPRAHDLLRGRRGSMRRAHGEIALARVLEGGGGARGTALGPACRLCQGAPPDDRFPIPSMASDSHTSAKSGSAAKAHLGGRNARSASPRGGSRSVLPPARLYSRDVRGAHRRLGPRRRRRRNIVGGTRRPAPPRPLASTFDFRRQRAMVARKARASRQPKRVGGPRVAPLARSGQDTVGVVVDRG
eukprot:CAMPEP_0176232298 /NCGR_PEP_ID=MMETSP0121_2-20121125/25239_1 /TAXON_ID=160619 /ORGANISM="Kryptoperidinium foliaceum, Strain CCMP 1326" /LENGTH=317 /DNA_ID=CAMNT_0017571661 /DNA_START=35 /DNA_END=986 /DNA_ORIENTATION=-